MGENEPQPRKLRYIEGGSCQACELPGYRNKFCRQCGWRGEPKCEKCGGYVAAKKFYMFMDLPEGREDRRCLCGIATSLELPQPVLRRREQRVAA